MAALMTREDAGAKSSIQETLYSSSIPGMQESIREGLQTPLDETNDELDW